MKKLIVATILAASSTSAFAEYYSPYGHNNESKFEFGYSHYSLDALGNTYTQGGGYLGLEHIDSRTNLGYQFGLEGFNYEGIDVYIGDLGMQYELPLDLRYLSVVPEAGIFHAAIDSSTDTSYYVGLNLKAEIIPDTLNGKIYAKRYDFTYDIWEKTTMGVKLSYAVSNDSYIEFGFEDAGLLSKANIGFGLEF